MKRISWLLLILLLSTPCRAELDSAQLGSAFRAVNSDQSGTTCVVGTVDKPADSYIADMIYMQTDQSKIQSTMSAIDVGAGYSGRFVNLSTSYEQHASDFVSESKSSTYIMVRGLATRTYHFVGSVSPAVATDPAYDFYTQCGTRYIRTIVKQHWFSAIADISTLATSESQSIQNSFKSAGGGYAVNAHVNTGNVEELQTFLSSHNVSFHVETSDQMKPFSTSLKVEEVWAAAQAMLNRSLDEGNPSTVSIGLGTYKDVGVDQSPEIEDAANAITVAIDENESIKSVLKSVDGYVTHSDDYTLPSDPEKLSTEIDQKRLKLEGAIAARLDQISVCREFLSMKPTDWGYKNRRNRCIVYKPAEVDHSLSFLPSSRECSPKEAAPTSSVGGGGCIQAERNSTGTCKCTACGFISSNFPMTASELIGMDNQKLSKPDDPLDPAKGQIFECRGMNPGADAVIEDHFVISPPSSPAEIGYYVTDPPNMNDTEGNVDHLRVESDAGTKVKADGTASTRLYMQYCWSPHDVHDTCRVLPDGSGFAITIREAGK